ncbi:MAG TPA: hypothetical protein VIK65_12065 [Candidatus Limnocylindrales bacterium]
MRTGLIAAAVVAATIGFVAGGAAGAAGVFGLHVPTSVGAGYVGEKVATLEADGTSYGVRDSVAWRDTSGSYHESGWPSCLSPGDVNGVRFSGATIWTGDSGSATVLFVDCWSQP